MVAMGDSLWTQLYPEKNYQRTYSLSSYSETSVDEVIDKHIGSEISREDWQLLISLYILLIFISTQ